MSRVGRDGLLYGSHVPGDDNYHNALTNIDFRVTPPVRRTSITLSPQPEIQFESYFEIPESGETTEATTPTQRTVLAVQLETAEGVEMEGARQPQSETGGTDSKTSILATGSREAAARRQPQNVSELFSGTAQPSADSSSSTAAEDAAHHEKSFGTNLTTGHREYLSQYSHTQDATENIDDKSESVASRSTQDDAISSDSSPSTLATDSSLSGDFSSVGGSDSTVATIDLDDGDIY